MGERTQERERLLEAVEGVREVVVAGIPEGEARGTLPKATVDALSTSGLSGLKIPAELGGAEADPVTQLEVLEALARIDGAAGWCLMIQGGSSGMVGGFVPDEAAEAVFGGSIPKVAGAVSPRGKAVPVDGGFQLSGRWQFGSGIRHADWVVSGARVADSDAPTAYRMFVVPRAQVEVHDNWRVSGLKGTGSCDYSLNDVFVSGSFSFQAMELFEGHARRGGPLYRMGMPGFVAMEHTAVALGIGRRALDEITDQASSKSRGLLPSAASALARRGSFQRDLGKADLELRAARALAVDVFERAWDLACGGRVPEPALQAEMRSVATYATEVAEAVVTTAYLYAGGGVLFESNPLQRCFRDIHAASQHFVVSNSSYEGLAGFRLGLPDANPMS